MRASVFVVAATSWACAGGEQPDRALTRDLIADAAVPPRTNAGTGGTTAATSNPNAPGSGAGGAQPGADAGSTGASADAATTVGGADTARAGDVTAGEASDMKAAPDGSAVAGAYECSQLLGPNVTGEWFAAGFETFVDGGRWQVKAPHRSFVEDWANPNHDVWRESNCQGTFTSCETKSKCAGGKAPDRIIFVTQTGNYLGTAQARWEESITAAIKTIKAKYPTVKRVDLMTFVRGPKNTSCGGETTVAPALDKAHEALAAASGGAIGVAPRFEVPRCDLFSGPPHFSAAGNRYVGELIGKHYAKE